MVSAKTKPTGTRQMRVPAYAAAKGVAPQSITRLIRTRDLPATMFRGVWHVDPNEADDWIRKNSPRIAGLTPIDLTPAERPTNSVSTGLKLVTSEPLQESPHEAVAENGHENGQVASTDHIGRLHTIIATALSAKNIDARTATSVRQLSTELRQLERHQVEMQEADHRLIAKAKHQRIIMEIACIIVDEITGATATLPDRILAALASAGIRTTKPKLALRVLGQATEEFGNELRERIANAIDDSKIL